MFCPWHESEFWTCSDAVQDTIELGFENALEVAATAGPVAQRMKCLGCRNTQNEGLVLWADRISDTSDND